MKQEHTEQVKQEFCEPINFFTGLPIDFDVGMLNLQDLQSQTEENMDPASDVLDLDVKPPPTLLNLDVLTNTCEEGSEVDISLDHFFSASDISDVNANLPPTVVVASDPSPLSAACEEATEERLQILDVLLDESTDISTYFRTLHSPSFQGILNQAENLIQNEFEGDLLKEGVETISYALLVFLFDESSVSKILSPSELDRTHNELKLKYNQLEGLQLKYYEMWEMRASAEEKLIAEQKLLADLEFEVERSRARISELEREVAELQSNNQQMANHLAMLEKVELTSRASVARTRLYVHLKFLRRLFGRP